MRCVPDTEKRQQAEILFQQHFGYKSVAKTLNVSEGTAKYWLLRRNSRQNQFDP